MFKLMPFQEADVQAFLDEPSYAMLNASTVGVGKTLIATEIARRLDAKRVLIMAPPNTFDGWERHFFQHCGRVVRQVGGANVSQKQAYIDLLSNREPGVYFVGWEWAARTGAFPGLELDFLVADEVHRAQNRKTKSAGVWWDLAQAAFRTEEGRVLAMSGTPAGNKLTGMWSVVSGLWPERYNTDRKKYKSAQTYWSWCKKNFKEDWNQYAGIPEYTVELSPGRVVKDLPAFRRHEQGVKCCEFHPRGVQEDLPKRVWHEVKVDLNASQRKLYDQMHKSMVAWMDDQHWPIQSGGLPMVQHMRLLQIALATPTVEMVTNYNNFGEGDDKGELKVSYPLDTKSSKIDAMLDILEDIPEGERVIVWTHSTAIIPAIVHRINSAKSGHTAIEWSGNTSHAQRAKIKDEFINGAINGRIGPKIIVAQIAALAEGVDGLQRVCSNEIWFSFSANNMQNQQSLGRLERTGQTRAVNAWKIVARATVEVEKNTNLTNRADRLTAALHN